MFIPSSGVVGFRRLSAAKTGISEFISAQEVKRIGIGSVWNIPADPIFSYSKKEGD